MSRDAVDGALASETSIMRPPVIFLRLGSGLSEVADPLVEPLTPMTVRAALRPLEGQYCGDVGPTW